MTSLRRSLVAVLAGGIALSGAAVLGAPASALTAAGTRPTADPRSPGLSGLASSGPAATTGDDQTVGRWRVTPHADGAYTVSWTSPDPLPVSDDRPTFARDGSPYAIPQLHADGTTLSVDVPADPGAAVPDPDDLDVVLSGRVLDTNEQGVPPPSASVVTPPPGTTPLTDDPGEKGDDEIRAKTYHLPGVKLAGMPAKVEMVGRVVWPRGVAAAGSAPLVLFLHGRHEACYRTPGTAGPRSSEWPCPRNTSPIPSFRGYEYVQDLLASQGYVTVSISANGINAQDWRLVDGGAAARGRLVREHLDAWADPARAADIGPAAALADLDHVVLVGHSRGGEGVNRASEQIPLSAPYRINGQILIGPTNFGHQTAPYVPTVTVLPYCDGDVYDLQGQTYTDLARDYAPGDTALHSSLLVMGANHNFFNTEWTPGLSRAPSFDDWFSGDDSSTCSVGTTSRLTKGEQRAVGKSYIAGAVRLMTADDPSDDAMLPLFDGRKVSLPSAHNTDVRSHAVGLGRAVRAPGRGATLARGLDKPAKTQICIGRSGTGVPSTWCGRGAGDGTTPHWVGSFPAGTPAQRAFEMRWTASQQEGGLQLTKPLDLTGRDLHLRTIVDADGGVQHLKVRVVDGSGNDVTVKRRVRPLPQGPFPLGKRWAQDLVVKNARLSTLDLEDIRQVDLISNDRSGRVWVLDVAAGAEILPPPPDKRTGTLTLKSLTIREGDGLKKTTAKLPFHISGDVSGPTRFLLSPAGFFGLRFGPSISVTVPPGRHDGTVRVPYRPNRLDDLRRRVYDVAAYGISGAMPTDYTASLTLLDDDPTPRMRLVPTRSHVREGGVARWTLRLSKPLHYYETAVVIVQRGPRGNQGLRGNDVRRSWLREHAATTNHPQRPLDTLDVFLASDLRPGRRTVTFSIPTRRDHAREGTEHVTIKAILSQAHRRASSTIQVRDTTRR